MVYEITCEQCGRKFTGLTEKQAQHQYTVHYTYKHQKPRYKRAEVIDTEEKQKEKEVKNGFNKLPAGGLFDSTTITNNKDKSYRDSDRADNTTDRLRDKSIVQRDDRRTDESLENEQGDSKELKRGSGQEHDSMDRK